MLVRSVLLGASLLLDQVQCRPHPIAVPLPPTDTKPISRDLQSFSFEFAFFPDFAGNKSHPNKFTKNLLDNLEKITGVSPIVRVGGTSQDHATYFPNQKENIQLIYQDPSDDQPSQINYGPAFFESYHTFGDTKFIHGLNLNDSDPVKLESSATEACKSIGSQLHLFELGNEFNFSPIMYRPSSYSLEDYVHEWNNKSERVRDVVNEVCEGFPGFMGPSFFLLDDINVGSLLKKLKDIENTTLPEFINPNKTAEELFNLGYDESRLVRELSFHNYMGLNMPIIPTPPNDLQRTLMNHTNIVEGLKPHVRRARKLAYLGHPYILGETNSIANQGRNGETNVFGDALWLVDFSLWAAEHNIERLHFHQGVDYRYASWQPVQTEVQAPTTRPPYYGHIMVASALGRSGNVRVVNIRLDRDTESAYAVYDGRKLSGLVVLNMKAFNRTSDEVRPNRDYVFRVPRKFTQAKFEWLTAPASDARDQITFGGVSYDYDLKQGEAVVVEQPETIRIHDGVIGVTVPDSSGVLLTLR